MCVALQDLSLQHITNILWTYASFLHDVPDMLPAFINQILERAHTDQFNAQQLSNLLWSLCILQVIWHFDTRGVGAGGCGVWGDRVGVGRGISTQQLSLLWSPTYFSGDLAH